MAYRRSLGLLASGLSILSGCGGAPSPMPSRPSSMASAHMAAASSRIDTPIADRTAPSPGACASLRASTLHPMHAGRGERVVLAKRDQTTLAFVANEDDGAIHTIDLDRRDEIGVTQLPGSPSALTLLSDGRLVVTLRDRNEMLVMEAAGESFETRCRVPVASEPVGLASFTENGSERLVVTAGYGHALGIVETKDFVGQKWVDLQRDPRAVLISNGRAFVSHTVSAKLSVVDMESGRVEQMDLLPNARARAANPSRKEGMFSGNQAFSLTMNERGRLFAPMVTVNSGPPVATSAYGNSEKPIKPFVGVVDLIAGKPLELPEPGSATHHLECNLPRAAAAMGDRLFVTCLGSDELVELDGRSRNAAEFIRRRVQLPRGPLGLALDGHKVVVMSQFDRVVSIVDMNDETSAPSMIALSRVESRNDTVFERGRQIFHDNFDPRISNDGRACASCHVDGREDGFTWSTPDGPRQTISLAGRIPSTAPYGWFGKHHDLRNHLSHTISRLGGQGFDAKDQADLDALVTYVSHMKAPVAVRQEKSDALIAEGHALFHSAAQGCGDCHAEGGTDRTRHDVGTGNVVEARLSFDTPSLVSIAGSAPYYHDGRFKSLDDLLSKSDDKMGHAKHLNADQRAAMVAYMESLSPSLPVERTTRTFVRPDKSVVLPPRVNGALEKLALRQDPVRKAWEIVDLDLDALPVVSVDPMVKYDDTNPEPQGGQIEKLLVWNGDCAAVGRHTAAHLQIDWRSTGMSNLFERCVWSPDDDGRRVWRDITAQTMDPLPDGRLHVEEHMGYFRVNTHDFWATSKIVADAVPIGDGVAYAFRTNCANCKEGERERLHIISPPTDWWGAEFFEWRKLRLDKGTSDMYSAQFNPPQLERWKKITKIAVETGGSIGAPKNVVFRVDTSRLFSEDKPYAVVGRTTCVEQDWSCK